MVALAKRWREERMGIGTGIGIDAGNDLFLLRLETMSS